MSVPSTFWELPLETFFYSESGSDDRMSDWGWRKPRVGAKQYRTNKENEIFYFKLFLFVLLFLYFSQNCGIQNCFALTLNAKIIFYDYFCFPMLTDTWSQIYAWTVVLRYPEKNYPWMYAAQHLHRSGLLNSTQRGRKD